MGIEISSHANGEETNRNRDPFPPVRLGDQLGCGWHPLGRTARQGEHRPSPVVLRGLGPLRSGATVVGVDEPIWAFQGRA